MPYPYLHFGAASNGLEQLIGDLVRGPRPGMVFLPCFNGHASSGLARICSGSGSEGFRPNYITSRRGPQMRGARWRKCGAFRALNSLEAY